MLFSGRSLWTMLHGIALGGGAMLLLAAALFAFYLTRPRPGWAAGESAAGPIAGLTASISGLLWLTSLVGMYIVFPPYRATPPEGTMNLSAYPRSMVLADPSTAWLHGFGMETKEHLPFVAAMLATSVAFVARRYRGQLLTGGAVHRMAVTLLVTCFAIVSYVSLLGVFVNKVAPLE